MKATTLALVFVFALTPALALDAAPTAEAPLYDPCQVATTAADLADSFTLNNPANDIKVMADLAHDTRDIICARRPVPAAK